MLCYTTEPLLWMKVYMVPITKHSMLFQPDGPCGKALMLANVLISCLDFLYVVQSNEWFSVYMYIFLHLLQINELQKLSN